MKKYNMAKQTDEQDIFALLEEIERRKQPAIDTLIEEINERIAKLTKLGQKYSLIEESQHVEDMMEEFEAREKKDKKSRAPKTCSNCGEKGHTTRTCPKPKQAEATA